MDGLSQGGETARGLVAQGRHDPPPQRPDLHLGGKMRRATFAALIAFALVLASVAPALAGFGGPGFSKINVWGTTNGYSHPEIDGSFVVPDGSYGSTSLVLYGSKDGFSWQPVGKIYTVNLVKGQTSYGFKFDIFSFRYSFFKVSGYGSDSRKFNKDECGYRVPEAPATPLLLLGAFPAVGLMAVKATGIRLPIPHLHRIV
jgi:hypothetical protein